jgi:transcription initiation factor TFIIIB Brf1 subunit/transcription initiation factor TFIIB
MKKTERGLPERLSPEHVLVAAIAVWPNQLSVAADVSTRASKIIQVAHGKSPSFFSGKSERGILSGLFYQLEVNAANTKTQKEIATALGTTEMTTRASCRDWLDCFPEFFRDKQN